MNELKKEQTKKEYNRGDNSNLEGAKSKGGEDREGKKAIVKLDKEKMIFVTSKLNYIEKLLKGRNWLIGKQLSIADFFFIELMGLLDWIDPEIRSKYTRFNNLIKKFNLLPEMFSYKSTQVIFDKARIYSMLKDL